MAAAGGVPQFASLYVGDLHPDVTEAMLYEIFNSVGPVASIRVCRDTVTRKSLGYGYINFHSVSDAERALDTLNYSSIKGRSCRLMWSQRDPSLRKSGTGNIHIKNLDKNIDNKALYDTFSLFGNILSCKVASDSATGSSYGYGFVQYETEEAAKQAIERVNGMQIGEKTVEVQAFQKRDTRDTSDDNFTNVYIKNLKQEWTDEAKLQEAFGQFGTVTSSIIRSDAQGRKFAFVNFEKNEDAKKCIAEMHMMDVRTDEEKEKGEGEEKLGPDGHPEGKLYVGRAQTKKEREKALKSKFTPTEPSNKGVNLYVKNLDENVDDDGMKELFSSFGDITSISVKKDDNGKCKGFGFVCFASPDDATKAVTEMHLKVVKGKPLYVGLAERREVRDERLRQRYSAPVMGGGKDGKGGKGFKGGKFGKGDMGGMAGGMGGMPGAMGGMPGGMGMPGGPGMMGGMPGGMGMMGGMPGGMGMQGLMMGGMKGGQMPGGMPMMGGMKGGPMAMPGKGMMPTAPMGMMGKGMPGAMGPMGMMRPPMPMQMMPQMMGKGMPGAAPGQAPQQQQPQQQPQQPQQAQAGGGGNLTAAQLAAAPAAVQKQMLGEKLYPQIARVQPELAGKITGMMLEMDNSELLSLLESPPQMKEKIDEALRVLQQK